MNLLAETMDWTPIIVILVIVALLAIVFWFIATRNGFVTLKNTVEEAFATIDVYLKKRYDLIPNLVETVKGYAKHESQTLEKVIAARNQAAAAKTTEEKMAADKQVSQAIKNINIVAEQYPDLKANANFLQLMGELKTIESELEKARRYYNGTVKTFNTKIALFPGSIVATSMGLEKLKYFELSSEEERQNVKVSF